MKNRGCGRQISRLGNQSFAGGSQMDLPEQSQ